VDLTEIWWTFCSGSDPGKDFSEHANKLLADFGNIRLETRSSMRATCVYTETECRSVAHSLRTVLRDLTTEMYREFW